MSRIDYDLNKIKGIAFDMDGVLSASTVAVREDGTLQRQSNVKDGFAIQYAQKCGLHLAVISGARDESMLPAYRSLGLEDIYFRSIDKVAVLKAWMEKHGLEPDNVIFVGDDIPDIPAMKEAGLAAVPRDASDEAKLVAGYISPCPGGHGVARDIISQILSSQDKWMTSDDIFNW
ncbi:MAG: HAD hydrolase family protein [Muribaculaceae bacterium]|nr:HAD hydrolase family protein [Muribaculaceae bacterium]